MRIGRGARAALAAAVLIPLLALLAHAEWLQPDASYRDAQMNLRMALRDTLGQGSNVARLDTLGVALLRLGRAADAIAVFRRVLDLNPGDNSAEAALGKLALFADRRGEAESLLVEAGTVDAGTLDDLFAARLRGFDWKAAAAMAPDVNQPGRLDVLERLATGEAWQITGAPQTDVLWARGSPTPLIKVKLNGTVVLMALDTGASDVLIDKSAARRLGVTPVGGDWSTFWLGSRQAVRAAWVPRLEIGGVRIANVPAGIIDLHKYSMQVNPQFEAVAGVIGMNVLRRFTPTIDFEANRLVLRTRGSDAAVQALSAPPADGRPVVRVPFELWGESEMMVYGSLAGSRRMAFVVQSGFPGGVAAPSEVMDEVGVKPGGVAKVMKSMGQMLQGRPWAECTVPTVTAGAMARDKVPAWSGAMDSGEMWRHGVRRDAVLGVEFFRGRRVTIDWDRHELVVVEK